MLTHPQPAIVACVCMHVCVRVCVCVCVLCVCVCVSVGHTTSACHVNVPELLLQWHTSVLLCPLQPTDTILLPVCSMVCVCVCVCVCVRVCVLVGVALQYWKVQMVKTHHCSFHLTVAVAMQKHGQLYVSCAWSSDMMHCSFWTVYIEQLCFWLPPQILGMQKIPTAGFTGHLQEYTNSINCTITCVYNDFQL